MQQEQVLTRCQSMFARCTGSFQLPWTRTVPLLNARKRLMRFRCALWSEGYGNARSCFTDSTNKPFALACVLTTPC